MRSACHVYFQMRSEARDCANHSSPHSHVPSLTPRIISFFGATIYCALPFNESYEDFVILDFLDIVCSSFFSLLTFSHPTLCDCRG